jgi:hypothetical protein
LLNQSVSNHCKAFASPYLLLSSLYEPAAFELTIASGPIDTVPMHRAIGGRTDAGLLRYLLVPTKY